VNKTQSSNIAPDKGYTVTGTETMCRDLKNTALLSQSIACRYIECQTAAPPIHIVFGNDFPGVRAFRPSCPKGRKSSFRLPGPASVAPRGPVQRTSSCHHKFLLQVQFYSPDWEWYQVRAVRAWQHVPAPV
jgi:hypothetical protein